MEDNIRIVKSLDDSCLCLKGVSETIENEVKEQKQGLLSMLIVKLGASLLGYILAGKRMKRVEEGFIRAGYGSSIRNKDF